MSTDFSISFSALTGLTWALGGTAIALSLGRYHIRWTSCGFLADDVAHLFAVLFMVAKYSLYTVGVPLNEAFMEYVATGGNSDLPDLATLDRLSLMSTISAFSSIWAVKFAFVLLYRTISGVSKPLKITWWTVLLFNILTFGGCIICILSLCKGGPAHILDDEACGDPQYLPTRNILEKMVFATVLSSDLATMLLPLGTMFKLKMRASHRAAVLFAMSVSAISIVFEILRGINTKIGSNNALWGNMECGVAVVVSTFPAYYSLLARMHERRWPTLHRFNSPDGKNAASSSCASPV